MLRTILDAHTNKSFKKNLASLLRCFCCRAKMCEKPTAKKYDYYELKQHSASFYCVKLAYLKYASYM